MTTATADASQNASDAVWLTIYRNKLDVTTAASEAISFDEFESRLTRHDPRQIKDGAGYSPASFRSSCECGKEACGADKGHRINTNVEAVHALVFDVDKQADGSLLKASDVTAIMKRLMEIGARFVVHTTHSHAPPDKFSLRVAFQLSRPVPALDWPSFWQAAVAHFGFHVEASCRNAARFWYWPSCPPATTPEAHRFEGAPLDVDALLAQAPPRQERQASSEYTFRDDLEMERRLRRARAYLDKIPGAVSGSGGHNQTFEAACALVRGFDLDSTVALEMLEADYNPRCDPPWTERELAHKVEGAVASDRPAGYLLGDRPGWTPPRSASGTGSERSATSGHDRPNADGDQGNVGDDKSPPWRPPVASDVLAADRPPIRVFTTGSPALDEQLGGGIESRTLTVVVARPAAGKTGYALGLARHFAVEHRVPVLYCSTELEDDESAGRIAAPLLRVPHRDISRGAVPRSVARQAITGLPIYILDCNHVQRGELALATIVEHARTLTTEYGTAPAIILDYVQMLPDDDPQHVRLSISALANALRALSQQLDTAIVAVSSTSRANYRPSKDAGDRDDPIAYLAAAKESGDIEFAAAVMLFLDVAAEHDNGTYRARIVVAKARRGTPGFVGAAFHGPTGAWAEDRGALAAMSGAARTGKAVAEQDAADETRVLEAVRAHGIKLAWRDIRPLCGIAGTRADRALARLLAAARVARVEVTVAGPTGKTRSQARLEVSQ